MVSILLGLILSAGVAGEAQDAPAAAPAAPAAEPAGKPVNHPGANPARGPVGAREPEPAVADRDLDRDRARGHWAFRPPAAPAPPDVKRGDWARSAVDRFILAKLEEKGLGPSPPAEPRTLVRRASFDLTGLPPSPDEVEAFVSDDSPGAYERLIDRLLASPRYGERWGRYWLDIARFADTKGYVYDREERRFVHSRSYREWVIRAFNDDMPYDRFLLCQIAADQMPAGETPAREDPAGAAIAGADHRDLAAMGFLTLGRRFLGVVHDIIDDRIDTLLRGTQALTVSCARCHDHKFDPIPTRDYYSLYGVFQGSTERLVRIGGAPERPKAGAAFEAELGKREAALEEKFRKKREELAERLRSRVAEYLAAVLDVEKLPSEEFYAILGADDVNPVIVRQWHGYLLETGKGFHPVFGAWHALSALSAGELSARAGSTLASLAPRLNPLVAKALEESRPSSMADVAKAYGGILARVHDEWRAALESAAKSGAPPPRALPDPAREELRQVLHGPDSPSSVPPGPISEIEWFFDEPSRVELDKLQAKIEELIVESPGAPPYAVILEEKPVQRNPRIFIRGNPAQKGSEVPRQLPEILAGPRRRPFERGSGRLELALAIASPENPLTARVMVNRVWLHHFGAGLVRTPSDFGARSDPPSHPELLDWLALRFVEEGWSLKSLHRLLMLSSAYRQSSDAPRVSAAAQRADPENRLLWRMNRARLDFEATRDSLLAVAGELDLAMGGRAVDLFARPFSRRRTVYGLIDRQFLPGAFRVFDFANPDQHSPERHSTTVPQQALFLLNGPFVVERARALARRAEGKAPDDPAERVRRLHRLAFQREATGPEVGAGVRFVAAAGAEPPPAQRPPGAGAWTCGLGEYDLASRRMKSFAPLPYFAEDAWQGGPAWPDPALGWVRLTAAGGHAGGDPAHAAVRRWTAPRDGTITIRGAVAHAGKEGDGVEARIVSSRDGLLASWVVQDRRAEAAIERVEVRRGDAIDFAVECRGGVHGDLFTWAPAIRMGAEEWDAAKDFSGPPPEPLTPWEEYAQALLLANELVFVD